MAGKGLEGRPLRPWGRFAARCLEGPGTPPGPPSPPVRAEWWRPGAGWLDGMRGGPRASGLPALAHSLPFSCPAHRADYFLFLGAATAANPLGRGVGGGLVPTRHAAGRRRPITQGKPCHLPSSPPTIPSPPRLLMQEDVKLVQLVQVRGAAPAAAAAAAGGQLWEAVKGQRGRGPQPAHLSPPRLACRSLLQTYGPQNWSLIAKVGGRVGAAGGCSLGALASPTAPARNPHKRRPVRSIAAPAPSCLVAARAPA